MFWGISQLAKELLPLQRPCFYSAKNTQGGRHICLHYLLQASVFLNGNGAGESSHISAYIKILPGEYDALLRWPFSHSVSFTLFDQSNVPEKVSPCLVCYYISVGFGKEDVTLHVTGLSLGSGFW
jgi:hypothetical protein